MHYLSKPVHQATKKDFLSYINDQHCYDEDALISRLCLGGGMSALSVSTIAMIKNGSVSRWGDNNH